MNVPTITPVILKHHIKADGSANIKLRLTHARKVRYIPTTEVATKKDYTKDLVIRNNAIIYRLSELVKKIENVINELGVFEVSSMDVDELVSEINKALVLKEKFKLEFFQWGREVASGKPKYSAANYLTALKSFSKFLERETLDISEVTSSMMRNYEAWLIKKHGENARAVSLYTAALSYIHSEARKKFNNEELDEIRIKNPFDYYKPPKQKPAPKTSIEKETIQKLINIRKHLSELHKQAVDTFLLSFCLMGSNVPDIYDAELEGHIIYYYRTKTRDRRYDNAEMQIRLEHACMSLIKEMLDPTGKKAFKLHLQYTFYKSIADKANDRLKEIAKVIGVKPFTMKAARSTWATVANSIGINKHLINDCLCHVDPDMAVTDIYIRKDWSVLWEANRKVLEEFQWE